jgi:flagellar biosynthesis/type III secretory pathway protein FliH
MALLRSGSESRDWENYRLDDYEEKKKAYLRTAAEEADTILKSARQKAGDILREAHSKGIEQAKAEALRLQTESEKKGYEEGLAKGKAEALELEKARYEEELLPIVEALAHVAKDYRTSSDELLDSAEKTLVKSSLELAKRVIEVESSFNREILDMRLKKSLQFLRPSLKMSVRIPVGCRERLEPLLSQHLQQEGEQAEVEWTEDVAMSDGALVVRSEDSMVQFDTEVQWKALLEKLKIKEEAS